MSDADDFLLTAEAKRQSNQPYLPANVALLRGEDGQPVPYSDLPLLTRPQALALVAAERERIRLELLAQAEEDERDAAEDRTCSCRAAALRDFARRLEGK